MRVTLEYGTTGLDVDLPHDTTVVVPQYREAVPDLDEHLRKALRRPTTGGSLADRVPEGCTVAIAVCDGTRPQPRRQVVEAILAELAGRVDPTDVTVLVATGSHRASTSEERREMFGDELARRVTIVDHDARADESLRWVGRLGDDVPVWLNARWLDADVRITTGLVEPHFFAGFSGGPKLVAPGLAGLQTILTLHDAKRIGAESARWGVIEGNPVHDDVRAIAAATGVDFTVEVVLNRDKGVVAAFTGDLPTAHAAACAAVRSTNMREVPHGYDVVVTSGSGYPLDQNLYQSVKGVSAAAQIVRPGGVIVCAAECRDGFPEHGMYRQLLASARSPHDYLARIAVADHTEPDQWQVQIQAGIQDTCRVVVHTTGLSDAQLASVHLEQTGDVGATVRACLTEAGPGATVCVLPEGPQTIPYLAAAGAVT